VDWKTAVAELFVKLEVVEKLWYKTNFQADPVAFLSAVSQVAIIMVANCANTRSVFGDTAVPEHAQTFTLFCKSTRVTFEFFGPFFG